MTASQPAPGTYAVPAATMIAEPVGAEQASVTHAAPVEVIQQPIMQPPSMEVTEPVCVQSQPVEENDPPPLPAPTPVPTDEDRYKFMHNSIEAAVVPQGEQVTIWNYCSEHFADVTCYTALGRRTRRHFAPNGSDITHICYVDRSRDAEEEFYEIRLHAGGELSRYAEAWPALGDDKVMAEPHVSYYVKKRHVYFASAEGIA